MSFIETLSIVTPPPSRLWLRRTLRCPLVGLALSPDGNHLLSNSMDNSVMMWDVRPFANENRLEKTFHGIKVTVRAVVALLPMSHGGARIVWQR